jgi:hypothetical protein
MLGSTTLEHIYLGLGRIDIAGRHFKHGGESDARNEWPPVRPHYENPAKPVESFERPSFGI